MPETFIMKRAKSPSHFLVHAINGLLRSLTSGPLGRLICFFAEYRTLIISLVHLTAKTSLQRIEKVGFQWPVILNKLNTPEI